jgi:hypothetical protein
VHLHLVPKSRICGSIPPLPHTSSWCSAELVKHGTTLPLFLVHCFKCTVAVGTCSIHLSNHAASVGFEGITAVIMKCSVFWDLMPCNPLKVNLHSSKISLNFHWTVRNYIPEDRTLAASPVPSCDEWCDWASGTQ